MTLGQIPGPDQPPPAAGRKVQRGTRSTESGVRVPESECMFPERSVSSSLMWGQHTNMGTMWWLRGWII